MRIDFREFLAYKFYNSLFVGLSVGSIFTLYAPLEPSLYSLGGIALALGMLLVAKLYSKILNISAFYWISLYVELVILGAVVWFLLFAYNYATALLFYVGYQLTFVFGSYLVRAETLFFPKHTLLSMLDVVKQKAYLAGMFLSYGFYTACEKLYDMSDKGDQVYAIHFLLLACEVLTIHKLLRAFQR